MLNANLHCVAMGLAVTGSERVRTGTGSSPPGRLIAIGRSNDLLLARLAEAGRRLVQAEGYAADPRSAARLGAALVAHAQRKRADVLRRLAANRAEAIDLLAGLPSSP